MVFTIGTIIFLILAAAAIASAFGMIFARNAVHAAMFLVANFMCIALFYLGLNAPFLAMVQITVYAGAIMVLFIFVIMLLGAEQVPLSSRLRWQPWLAGAITLLAVIMSFVVAANPDSTQLGTPESIGVIEEDAKPIETFGSAQSVGASLYSSYMLPFQVVGLLLLVAMIGAVILAKEDIKVFNPAALNRRRYIDPESLRVSSLTEPSGDK